MALLARKKVKYVSERTLMFCSKNSTFLNEHNAESVLTAPNDVLSEKFTMLS